ncbi:hypothetical protein QQ045_002789 [Rhodiola kirilowii]
MEDWRPISLCTVAVKIITKILAMRLQPILDQIISPFHSAFIKGRIISDNIVVAHEISHYMRSRRDDKNFYASIKVDMSKAYDRVEWMFLERLLLKLGFEDKWVARVMLCVNSVSYQVKVNDKLSTRIMPGRGLRQGDPLSPYLFLLCTELLNFKMEQVAGRKKISGIQIYRKAPTITHLLFADDSIFFVKADRDEVSSLKDVFSQYEGVSGQRINFEKSEVCFSHNTPADVRREISNLLRMPQVHCHSKYLGLPLVVGQRKSENFKCVIEKIWRKVKDWKSKLSAAGREVLVKAVIQAIPVYMMAVYQFPKKVISELSKMIQQFWWAKKGNKGISWLSQNILQKKKCEGGLGFKNLSIFNEAILMKIAWRMCIENWGLARPGFDPADWLWSCLASCSAEDSRTLLVAAWVCWKNRNRVWHGLDSWSAQFAGIVSRSLLSLSGFLFCPRPWENSSLEAGWSPPEDDCIKINSDGAWNGIANKASIGIVARDHLGTVLWAWADQEDHCFCAGEVEGRALLRGLEMANKFKASNARFEVDMMLWRCTRLSRSVKEWAIGAYRGFFLL